jgi:hypothetical protein
VAGVALLCGVLAGCGDGAVSVDRYAVTPAGKEACPAFLSHLPDRVADHQRRRTTGSTMAAAWGDPPIVLRCGVGKPAGFDRFSGCQRADGIDWYVPQHAIDDQSADVVMTTIGRSPAVEVVVPARYRPPVAAMVDLTPALKAHTDKVGGCR